MSKNKLSKVPKELIVRDTKDLGRAIHSEAMAREKKAREDRVIAEVQRIENARLEYLHKADFAQKATEWYARKLEAIRAGEFDFDLATGAMLFHNPDFERANY